MNRLGIDLGTSAVKLALLDERDMLQKWKYRLHHGFPICAEGLPITFNEN